MVDPLDKHRFNPDHNEAERCTVSTCYMRHISTGCWGVNNVKCPGWSRNLDKEKQLVLAARKPKPALLSKETHLTEARKAARAHAEEDAAESKITDAFVDEFVNKLENSLDHGGKGKHRVSLLETGSTNGPARIFEHLVGPHLAVWARYLEAAESLQ